jgi:hypothetical protein
MIANPFFFLKIAYSLQNNTSIDVKTGSSKSADFDATQLKISEIC